MQHHFYFICRQNAVLSALFVYRFRSADFCAHLTKAPPNFLATCSPSPEPLLTGPASAPARQNPDSPPLHIPLPHSRRGQAQIGYRQQNLLSVYSQNTPSPRQAAGYIFIQWPLLLPPYREKRQRGPPVFVSCHNLATPAAVYSKPTYPAFHSRIARSAPAAKSPPPAGILLYVYSYSTHLFLGIVEAISGQITPLRRRKKI
jgi:hypothetical protein